MFRTCLHNTALLERNITVKHDLPVVLRQSRVDVIVLDRGATRAVNAPPVTADNARCAANRVTYCRLERRAATLVSGVGTSAGR